MRDKNTQIKAQGKSMTTIPLKILLTSILLLSNSALAAQKLALIIGNNNYSRDIGALTNPINDAIAIDKKLKSMGFDTILIKNANKRQMLDAFDTFQEKLEHGSTAIFYYAGHGIEAGNRSYLIPVDATIPKNPNNYSDEFFDMRDKAMNSMLSSAAENKILIIDACRNSLDPIKRAVGGNTRGFSRTSMAVDSQSSNAGKMSVLFSTLSGSEALDASPFAKALLDNLDKPNATWPELVSDISTSVRQNTKGTQQVWSEGGTELAYFKLLPVAESKPVPVAAPALPDAELVYWDSIKSSTNASDYTAYLQDYPRGRFAGLAKNRQQQYAPKLTVPSPAQVQGKPHNQSKSDKMALIIGNSQYQNVQDSLKNPVNDAKAIAARLKELGFETEILLNANLDTMLEAINRARSKVSANGTLVFYYAGHGVQLDGENYLVPVDAHMANSGSMLRETIKFKEVVDKFNNSSAAFRMFILDACRNDPFPKAFRSSTRGLAREQLTTGNGSMVMYAASPSEVAADGQGEHGTFTQALLQGFNQSGVKLPEMMDDIREQVHRETKGTQNPYYEGSGVSSFVFVPAAPVTSNP